MRLASVATVLIFAYIILRSAFPNLPEPLTEEFKVCNFDDLNSWAGERAQAYSLTSQEDGSQKFFELVFAEPPSHGIMFWCENFIPHDVILRANTINTILEINQKVNMQLSFYRKKGGGPTWENISIDPNRAVSVSHPLDRPKDRKINWLVGEFGQMAFLITGYDYKKDVRIKIYKTYLR